MLPNKLLNPLNPIQSHTIMYRHNDIAVPLYPVSVSAYIHRILPRMHF